MAVGAVAGCRSLVLFRMNSEEENESSPESPVRSNGSVRDIVSWFRLNTGCCSMLTPTRLPGFLDALSSEVCPPRLIQASETHDEGAASLHT